ncbi:MAG: RagB/SusD family nutrient uptake outer membrane protein [Rikenellaceae bacterium]|nr:RagB/SusD family nutrient uptake outer membrane protein [Rikenellaceae bacterium]
MKNILKKITLVAGAAFLLTSCIEETFPESSTVTSDQVAASPVALEAMVNSIPTAMIMPMQYTEYAWDFGYPAIAVSMTHMTGDLVAGGENGYNWFSYWDSNESLSEEYVLGYQFWYNYYSWIKSCNDVIATVAAVPQEQWNVDQRHFMGIALAYRSFFYLDLVRLFEPKVPTDPGVKRYEVSQDIQGLGCVIVTEKTTPEQAASNPRATVADIYDQVILPDLALAETCLIDYERTAKTMPDISVVYGLSARAYLERGYAGVEGAYAKAAEYARKAITAGGYTPLTQDQWENPTTGFNSFEANSNSWMWCTTQTSDQVGNLHSFIAHMSTEENWTNYGKTVGRSINKNLYDAIPSDDFRKHTWLDPQFFDYYEYKSCRPDAKTFFLERYNGTDYTKEYASLKFRPGQGDYTTYSIGNAIDFPTMRMEEMLLIEAEAVGAQNLEQGKKLLEAFVQTRQPSYNCMVASQKDFEKEIGMQARVEFWGEGIPFFYKKRMGLGINLANSNCKVDDARFELVGVAPWWNLCIPKTERLSNPAITAEMNNPDPNETVDPVIE